MEVHSPVQQSLSQASSRQRQLADSSSSSSQSTSSSSQEFELPLSPFQLHLDLNTSSAMSSGEEMMLLSVTQAYLSSVLKQIEPNFSRLALYQFVRDFHNLYYSKVAFGGMAYFFGQAMNSSQMHIDLMLSFMGQNATKFLTRLQDSGISQIINVTLISIDGKAMDYLDGKIVEMGASNASNGNETGNLSGGVSQPNSGSVSSREMSGDMRMMTLLLSLLIPGVVFCLACAIYVMRSAREINWSKARTSPDAPVWQSSLHLKTSPNFEEEKAEGG